MKHTTLLLLPAFLTLISCGTVSQYSQQRFTDGVYSRVTEEEPVYIYSKDDFAAMANARIAKEKSIGGSKDTVYVVLDNSDYYNNYWTSPFYWGSYRYGWYNPWFYGSLYYSSLYAWNWGWFDPWYDWGWYSPWYSYRYPYYYPYHYHRHSWNPQPLRPGLSPDGRHYYGRRSDTYSGGTRMNRPGSGSGYNYRRSTNTAGRGTYGSSGVSGSRPSSNNNNRSTTPSGTNGYNYRRSSGSSNNSSTVRSNPSSSSSRIGSGGFSGGSSSRSGSMGGGGSRSGGGGSRGGGGRR